MERIERMVRSAKVPAFVEQGSPHGAMHATLRILFASDWKRRWQSMRPSLVLEVDKKRVALDEIMPDQAVYLNRADGELMNKLEEIGGGGIRKRMEVSMAQWVDILPHVSSDTIQVVKQRRYLSIKDNRDRSRNGSRPRDRGTHPQRGHAGVIGKSPLYFLGEEHGYIVSKIRSMRSIRYCPVLCEAYRQPVRIERSKVPSFLMSELVQLEKEMVLHKKITADLFFMKPAKPTFRLQIKGVLPP